ncbi:MAG: DUF421 domain-containing protein [Actinobacteria bacterium]|nr:DUF421 domain-containing protein [Actinomycetota bacterium]
MPVAEWLGSSWGVIAMVVVSTVAIYAAIIVYTRVVGLRSFSKMSSFDFAITVAFGSIMASVAIFPGATLANGVVALGTLYLLQVAVGVLRRWSAVQSAVDNKPRILMVGTEIQHDQLKAARVTENDIRAKLREANVIDPQQIRAVVMESTGDIAVLHADPDGPELDLELLTGVHGVDRFPR